MNIPNIDRIESLTDWNAKPVLIAGKGPSFANRPSDLADKFHVVCINQTASFQHCVLAVMNDFESWLDTEPVNPDMAVALPAIPHWYQSPGKYDLEHWVSIEKSARRLHDRGLLETTLVVVTGEFGRTPKMGQITQSNNTVQSGRDHWPHAFTVLLAGGGVRGGQIYGETTKNGGYVADRPVTPADLTATILFHLGVDVAVEYLDEFQRVRQRICDGSPVRDLG